MIQQPKAKSERKPIKCPYTGRLLAEYDEENVYLMCKGCKHAHSIPITQLLQQLAQEVTQTA
jgi:hypothetical protein